MAEERTPSPAWSIYETICQMFDDKNLKYERQDDKLMVKSNFRGDGLPIDFIMFVNQKNAVVSLISSLPFSMANERRAEGAVAVSIANYGLIDGSFDYDINDGEIRFRMTESYLGSLLSKELFGYMVMTAVGTVDRYNDKFYLLSTGVWTIEQFVSWDKDENNE